MIGTLRNILNLRACCLLLILIAGCEPVEFKDPVVVLEIPNESIKADGFTVIPLRVGLAVNDAKEELKLVKIETQAGLFNTASGLKNETTVKINPGDTVTVNLIAGLKPGDFEVKASINARPELLTTQVLTLSPVLSNDVISLITLDPDTLLADGKTLIMGTVTLENTDKRQVSLETTDKTAVFTGDSDHTINLTADNSGLVNFSFKPGIVPGSYSIIAKLLNDDRNLQATRSFLLNPLRPADVIKLTLTNTTNVKADGVSLIHGKITLQNTEKRSITVDSTDPLAIIVGHSNSASLTTDTNGEAEFELKVSSNPGTYYVRVRLNNDDRGFQIQSSYKTNALGSADILSLTLPSGNVYADGASVVTGVVAVQNTSINLVQVNISHGEFLDASGLKQKDIQLDPQGSKSFAFRVANAVADGNDTISYLIEAKLKNTNFSVVRFLRVYAARPNTFFLEPSNYSIPAATGSITVKAIMSRSGGKVSNGVQVSFQATQTIAGVETLVGRFVNGGVSHAQEQIATTTFTTSDRPPVAGTPVIIKATTQLEDGSISTQTVQINVM